MVSSGRSGAAGRGRWCPPIGKGLAPSPARALPGPAFSCGLAQALPGLARALPGLVQVPPLPGLVPRIRVWPCLALPGPCLALVFLTLAMSFGSWWSQRASGSRYRRVTLPPAREFEVHSMRVNLRVLNLRRTETLRRNLRRNPPQKPPQGCCDCALKLVRRNLRRNPPQKPPQKPPAETSAETPRRNL